MSTEPTLRDQIVNVELEAIHWLACGRGLPHLRESLIKAVRMIDARNSIERTHAIAEASRLMKEHRNGQQ